MSRISGISDEQSAEPTVVFFAPANEHAAEVLQAAGYRVMRPDSAFDALKMLQGGDVQVVVVDWDAPEASGPSVIAAVHQDDSLRSVAAVALGRDGSGGAVSAFALGADEFVGIGAGGAELLARVAAAIGRKLAVEGMRDDNARLQRQVVHLQDSSLTDSLTGLANRRHLEELFASLGSAARRQDWPIALAMLDIDHFKTVNDTLGHDRGDDAIRLVSQRLLRALRLEDYAGRWGGDEFVLILPMTDLDGALVVAERVRSIVAEPVSSTDTDIKVTVSIGVAWGLHESPTELLRRADVALYRSKVLGRDRVTAWERDDFAEVAV